MFLHVAVEPFMGVVVDFSYWLNAIDGYFWEDFALLL